MNIIIDKKIRFVCFLFFIFLTTLSSCAQGGSETLRMGIFSDAHFLSPKLMDGGEAIQQYDLNSGKTVIQVPQVFDQVLDDYLNSDIEILLFPGDMTKDGEKQSHLDFVEKLKPLIKKGVRVFVIPGNHDVSRPNSLGYKGRETYKVDNVSPEEFVQIYADCGYKDAISRDQNSLSYVAELNPSTWLLAIDCQKYDEYATKGITSSGRIKPETEKWIVEVAEEAKRNNIQLVGMMHHNLLEHIPMQSTFFSEYLVDDWQKYRSFFANLGMKVMFTGHFHVNDIASHTDDELHKIHDVSTGSLVAYSYPYRFVDLDKKGMKISTKNITSTPDAPHLMADNKIFMEKRIREVAQGIIHNKGWEFSPKTQNLILDVTSKMFVNLMAGHRAVDDELKEKIKELSEELGTPVDLSLPLMTGENHNSGNDVVIEF